VEVELRRPELSEPEWLDRDGNGTEKGLVGEAVKLTVTCKGDMEEGAGVVFRVYAEGADPKKDKAVAELASENREGKAEAEWVYRYTHDPENPLKEKPKYFFTATGRRCKEAKSGNVEMSQNLYIEILNRYKKPLTETIDYELKHPSGETMSDSTSEGVIDKQDLIPGEWELVIARQEEDES
jgi:hypothetical protein